jgi:uncharacterized membrane protein
MIARGLTSSRVALLVAAACSAVLLVDLSSVLPVYTAFGSESWNVLRSGYSRLPGLRVPLPLVGLIGLGLLFAVTLLPSSRRARLLLRGGALMAGLAGLCQLVLQAFVLRAFCPWCVAVDVCLLALALLVLAPRRLHIVGQPAPDPLRLWAWTLLAAVVITAPLVWPLVRPLDPLPPALQRYQGEHSPTVIAFSDFECRACRALHPVLEAVLAEQPEVRFVQLHYPVDVHPLARDAARAAVCAERQGLGRAMSSALFATSDLRPSACRKLALSLGARADVFDACLAEPGVEAELREQAALLRSAGPALVPTTFVGRERLVGRVSDARLRRALVRAREGGFEVAAHWYWLACGLCGLALVALGRSRGPAAASESASSVPQQDAAVAPSGGAR